MPYTNAWLTTTPDGAVDPASGADDDMRKIRLDVEERMETLVGAGNWSTDPVAPFGGDNVIFVPWTDFNILSVGGATWNNGIGTNYGVSPNASATYTLYAPLKLPRGVTVTEIAIIGQTHTAGTLTLTLESVDTTGAPAQATLATATMTQGVTQTSKDSGAITVVLDDDGATNFIFYYLKLVMVSGAVSSTWFQGARVTYTRDSLAQAI